MRLLFLAAALLLTACSSRPAGPGIRRLIQIELHRAHLNRAR